MTTSAAAVAAALPADLRAPVRRLARQVARNLTVKLDGWQRQVKGASEPQGPLDHAVVAGLHALATGKEHPALAAVRAAWAGSEARTRAAMVGLLLLLVVTAPLVLLGLLLLGAAIAVAMKAARPSVG